MKKLLAITLTSVILMVCTILPSAAQTTDEHIFENKFAAKYKSPEYFYDELYYHFADDDTIDWVLVEGDIYAGTPAATKYLVFDRILTYGMQLPFSCGYAIYDVKYDCFIPLNNDEASEYEGLEEALNEMPFGNPLGDADLDGNLTIYDATFIQRALAKLCDYNAKDDITEYWFKGVISYSSYDYISDINNDGVRDIIDATLIQQKLVKE